MKQKLFLIVITLAICTGCGNLITVPDYPDDLAEPETRLIIDNGSSYYITWQVENKAPNGYAYIRPGSKKSYNYDPDIYGLRPTIVVTYYDNNYTYHHTARGIRQIVTGDNLIVVSDKYVHVNVQL